MHSAPPMPPAPDDVEFSAGIFTNAQGLRLATFCYQQASSTPKGIVFLLHGYGCALLHRWGGGWRAARSLPDICWRVAQLAHAVRVAARPGTGRAAHKVRRHGR